ncbi:M23 family metallopeptidase [Corynebacterium sp. TA-R-1]|uniref:M23 family metallopeptidase n=1 Tax=Corynebacterium stercoris TaxID=2943490 RepID=A0ABT1G5M9_9CORY|nr:M23 family metallopeptidase [Corynebacterium stercoris]MCP1388348.1 M23 family metallopeptidase [Corynebacterium stercoris]
MKRRLLAAAVAAALAASAAAAPTANAVNIQINGAQIETAKQALAALAGAASNVADTGATSSIGDYTIVFDPRVLGEEIAAAFADVAPATVEPGRVAYQRGRTADGRTVVTPTVGRLTSGFGPRWGRMHQGIDIANAIGTPIYAVMDGTVIKAGPAQGFGKWVVIKHDGGEVSVYGHIVSYNVSVGERVTAGQQIAKMGNEGQSTGPHLHFEIKPNGETQVDPRPWFAQAGITI